MWPWILLGWTVLSLGAVVVFRWLKRSPSVMGPEYVRFLETFQRELALRHPDVQYCGLLPRRMVVVIRVRGQETPILLGRLYRHYQAFPDAFGNLIDRLVEDVEAEGLDRTSDHSFGEVATDIMPQIRSRAWVDSRRFGDGGLVYRSLGDDLVVTYVIDDPVTIVFICRAHLKQWGRSEEDLYQLASRNLERRCHAQLLAPGSDNDLLLNTGDGYDAARVLLLDPESEGLLVAMPDRDVLWVSSAHDANLGQLMKANLELNQNAAHPVSPRLYRWEHGQLTAVSEPDR